MTPAERRTEWLLLAPLAMVSLALNFIGLTWGLPNGELTWAVDALRPMTPLAVAHHLFSGGWNSGWFFFKYPPGHPLLLSGIYAPYLAWLRMTGGLGRPAMDYPFGFTNPEQALLVLAVLGRAVSALMTTAATLLWYWTCREAFARRTAWLAAWFYATMFPIVYYAHTTNVDSALLFWCVLALYGAARVYHRADDRTGMIILGGAAAMAVSTKESAFPLLVTLPLMLVADRLRRRRGPAPVTLLPPGTWLGCVVALIVFAAMNGAVINPLGVWHRAHFLTDSMPAALRGQFAPRLSQVGSAAPKTLAVEAAQVAETFRVVAASIGWPLAIAAAISCIGYGWRRPAAFLVIAAAGYYLGSIRAFEVLRPRYVLPLSLLACGLAAFALEWAARLTHGPATRRLLAVVTGALVVYSGVRGIDAARLLRDDSRYAAEAWLRAHATAETSIEVYQQPASLPRFERSARLATIPFDHISIPEFVSRRPDIVVLSSAGLADVTSRCKSKSDLEDDGDAADGVVSWRGWTGNTIAVVYAHNRAFIDALEGGCLGYNLAARFKTTPWVAAATIPSLAPEIRIYQRQGAAAQHATATRCRRLLADATSAAEPGNAS